MGEAVVQLVKEDIQNMNKYLLITLLAIALALLSGCNQKPKQNKETLSNDTVSAPIPTALMAIGTLDISNFLVTIEVDGGGAQNCNNLVVTPAAPAMVGPPAVAATAGTYSCDLSLVVGSHTLTLISSIIDSTYGTVRVTAQSDIVVEVVVDESTVADLGAATLLFYDDNNDGLTNLAELIAGSDPFASGNWDQLVWDSGTWK